MSAQAEEQRRFYETRPHEHLQPRGGDFYVSKLVSRLVAAAGIGADDRVLEVGCGFGRFSFDLLEHCASLEALDLSPRALARLEAERDARGIPAARCRTRCLDLAHLDPAALGERFRSVAGFFMLHHLDDMDGAIQRLAAVLAPGGTLAFIEPNRRNPLFLAQIACCPDMGWAEERGVFRLTAERVARAFRSAGLTPAPVSRFGFFPPQLVNRSAGVRRLETWLEGRPVLEPVLPFLLLTARAEGG